VEDDAQNTAAAGGSARRDRALGVLETLSGLEAEIKGSAIIAAGGEVLASTVDDPGWGQAAVDLLETLGSTDGEPLDSSHIATEQAEIFVVTEGDLALIVVSARFVLASLTTFDMRMSLRDLAASHA